MSEVCGRRGGSGRTFYRNLTSARPASPRWSDSPELPSPAAPVLRTGAAGGDDEDERARREECASHPGRIRRGACECHTRWELLEGGHMGEMRERMLRGELYIADDPESEAEYARGQELGTDLN